MGGGASGTTVVHPHQAPIKITHSKRRFTVKTLAIWALVLTTLSFVVGALEKVKVRERRAFIQCV